MAVAGLLAVLPQLMTVYRHRRHWLDRTICCLCPGKRPLVPDVGVFILH